MGFLRRRKTEKFLAELDQLGVQMDASAEWPLPNPEAQALRVGAEERLAGLDAPMPAAWAQTGLDLTNLHDEVADHEHDAWAFTDALMVGYYVRAEQLARGNAVPPDAELSARLNVPDPVAAARARLETVRELAHTIGTRSGLADETWQAVRSWTRLHGLRRSRERARQAGGPLAIPSPVPYEEAFDAGYALHYAQEAADSDAEPVALTRGPLARGDAAPAPADEVELPTVDSRADAEGLLMATEDLFVTLAAPSRLAIAALQVIMQSSGIGHDDPYYGAYVGIALFGYACRMTQHLDVDDHGAILDQLLYDRDGNIDWDAIAGQPERLGAMAQWVADLAGDPDTVPHLLGATPHGWQRFVEVAAGQLRLNLRSNGMPRRALPDDSLITEFLRLGYATRLLDEAAGEQPLFKHER